MRDKNLCPECWSQDTNDDPFPEWAWVAPCLDHIVGKRWALLTMERRLKQEDELRKEFEK